jgi:Na+-translocating ferredoxin:NAD+ oxidoreductase subunit G
VRRDGGVFDQFTGATVTPRAVVRAVRDALVYFEAHRDELFAAPAGAAGLPAPVAKQEDQ